MILVAGLLILAWRNAGWYGADRWLLPALGTPWQHRPTRRAAAAAGEQGGGRR